MFVEMEMNPQEMFNFVFFYEKFDYGLAFIGFIYFQKQPSSYFAKISGFFSRSDLKRFLEHIKFSRRLRCNKNTSNFPGEDNSLIRIR